VFEVMARRFAVKFGKHKVTDLKPQAFDQAIDVGLPIRIVDQFAGKRDLCVEGKPAIPDGLIAVS
jgi:hypothetical protein